MAFESDLTTTTAVCKESKTCNGNVSSLRRCLMCLRGFHFECQRLTIPKLQFDENWLAITVMFWSSLFHTFHISQNSKHRCGCFQSEDFVHFEGKLSSCCQIPCTSVSGDDTELSFAHRVATQDPLFLYCIDVDIIKNSKPAPTGLRTIRSGEIVIGCYVNQPSSSRPARQIFVAIVCCKCPYNSNNVVVRFQSSSDHLYQFSGGFFSIRADRLVSPYNCVLQHLPKTTVLGIPGLKNHLGFIATFNEHQIEIGDFLQYQNKDRTLSCLSIIVGFIYETNKWNIIVVVDPTPSGGTDNGWKSRLCLIQSSTLFSDVAVGSMVIWRLLSMKPKTKKLVDEVIHCTRETVGIHASQGGVITADLSQIMKYRIAKVQQNKDEASTIYDLNGKVQFPESTSNEESTIFIHPARVMIHVDRFHLFIILMHIIRNINNIYRPDFYKIDKMRTIIPRNLTQGLQMLKNVAARLQHLAAENLNQYL